MRKKRVALVVPALSNDGGVSTMARFIYRILMESEDFVPDFVSVATASRDITSVRVLNPKSWFHKPGVRCEIKDGVSYRHVGCWWAEFEFQRYRPRKILTDILKEYDLVQIVAGGPALGWAAIGSGRPTLLFVATTAMNERASALRDISTVRKAWLWLMTRFTINIEHCALNHVNYVFAESIYTQTLIAPYVSPNRLSLGFPGVDTRVFVPEDYCSDGYILAVGRWSDPRKNVRLLFEAYHQLRISRPNAPHLALVGVAKPREIDWDYANELGITDAIEIKEAVSSQRLPEIYRQAALFVLTSNEEGLGIVILEAMASGLPVVSTRCGGPESAVVDGETGLLTPVGQASEFALAMEHLLDDSVLRQRMGMAGRRRVERMFSLEIAGSAYLKTYRSILQL